MRTPAHQLLAVATRGGSPENMHWGSVAVVNADGTLLACVGDAQASTFARSTIKPIQALPFVRAGGLQRYGWGSRQAAMLCASHSAEACHLELVQQMLDSAGNSVADLGCGAHVPLDYLARDETPPQDCEWTPLHNNCSGKHAGFLACCEMRGWSRQGYLEPDHPLQRDIRAALGDFVGMDVDAVPRGIDGCSAPIYALPLARLAYAFARLARCEDSAATSLRDAMRSEPRLVSGSGRFDLLLAGYGAGDWIVKGGADGLQLLASVSRGIGVAVKVADGNLRALNAVVLDVLRQLGWREEPLPAALAVHDVPAITNWRGMRTGELRSCATLEFS